MAVNVEEAFNRIYSHVKAKRSEITSLENALSRILSEDIVATHNLPPFDNSAMDGFAISFSDAGKSVEVLGTIFAGDDSHLIVSEGKATKIMTGARIPEGCEAVVPQENTTQEDDGVGIPDDIREAQHIRLCGEDIKIGDTLLHKGDVLQAHHITLLASQGISHVKVYKKPRIALFASGSELKMHFEQVKEYQLYNTNTPTFCARSRELGAEVNFVGTAVDTLEDIHEHIESALDSDLIITSGGVSVGEADFTKEAFSVYNYENIFEKIEIKPGKPTTFGKIGNTFVLNLAGNPLAASLNFELFAQAIILSLSGTSHKYLKPLHVKMKEEYTLRAGRRTLVPGFYDGEFFEVCDKFAPGMVSPLASSNGIIMIDESVSLIKKGESVKFLSTKFGFYSDKKEDIVSK